LAPKEKKPLVANNWRSRSGAYAHKEPERGDKGEGKKSGQVLAGQKKFAAKKNCNPVKQNQGGPVYQKHEQPAAPTKKKLQNMKRARGGPSCGEKKITHRDSIK